MKTIAKLVDVLSFPVFWIPFFLLCLTILFSCQQAPRKPSFIPPGDYTYAKSYVDYQIRKVMKDLDIPSVAVAMIDDQETIFARVYGLADIEKNLPVTPDTIYKMGSIAKVFTGIEVMRMAEEGLIDLEEPITNYLPTFSIKSRFPKSDPITIRSLLAHRSGLPRNSNLTEWQWDIRPYVLKAQTDSLAESYQAFPPGLKYKYSNIGYNVLGRLIEVVRKLEAPAENTAGGWPYYMNEAVLFRMGMTNSSFGTSSLLFGKKSTLDTAMGYNYEKSKNTPCNQYDIICLASGSLQSTLNDMIKFVKYIIGIGEIADNSLIRKDTLLSMFTPYYTRPRDPQTNGLAWFTDTKTLSELIVFHSGTNQGFISLVAYMPNQKIGFVIFANSDRFEDKQYPLAVDALRAMMEAKFGRAVPEKIPGPSVKADIDILETFLGRYIVNGEVIEIIRKADRLKAKYRGKTVSMDAVGQNRFRLSHWLADVENIELEFFLEDPEEEDILILTLDGSYHITCPRYPEIRDRFIAWNELIGEYDLYPRIPSGYSDVKVMGRIEIMIKDGVLCTSDKKVLKPIDERRLRIVGGIFDGELMIRDPETGNIIWQNVIYKPI